MWQVRIHHLVIEEDFKKLDTHQRSNITRTIRKKLSLAPKDYGTRLTGEFGNYWKLRVGDYRVIYRVVEAKVLVLVIKVGIRRDYQVYEELFSRLKKLTSRSPSFRIG